MNLEQNFELPNEIFQYLYEKSERYLYYLVCIFARSICLQVIRYNI